MHASAGKIIGTILKNYGVTCVFGMEDPVELIHALDRDAIRIITVRDEKHAAIMAHGYAQVTGRPGICTSTFGPGATNLITGLLEAQCSSVPVIAFVQDHGLAYKNRNASSALDHITALRPFVKDVLRIDLPDQAAGLVKTAFRLATTGRPGPVVVLCPADVMVEQTEADVRCDSRYSQCPANRSRPGDNEIEAANLLITNAERPLIIAGGGCMISNAATEVVSFAEALGIPVATTMTGRGTIADAHPLSVGPLGSSTGGKYGRGQVANAAFEEADLVLMLGTRTGQICYSDWTLPKPETQIIHVDIDPAEIGRNFPTDIALVGDIRLTISGLHNCAKSAKPDVAAIKNRQKLIAQRKLAWRSEFASIANSNKMPVQPERLLNEISNRIDTSSLLVTDASYITGWAMSHIDVPASGRFVLSPRGTGGIGWSLPAAMGAKLADPSRTLICMSGDGAFGYVFNELETAARYEIPLLMVVFNNSTLGFQRHWEQKLKGEYRQCDFLDIDYSEVARSLKCNGERVHEPAEIGAALDRGLASRGPYVLDVVIDPDSAAPIVGFENVLAADAVH